MCVGGGGVAVHWSLLNPGRKTCLVSKSTAGQNSNTNHYLSSVYMYKHVIWNVNFTAFDAQYVYKIIYLWFTNSAQVCMGLLSQDQNKKKIISPKWMKEIDFVHVELWIYWKLLAGPCISIHLEYTVIWSNKIFIHHRHTTRIRIQWALYEKNIHIHCKFQSKNPELLEFLKKKDSSRNWTHLIKFYI